MPRYFFEVLGEAIRYEDGDGEDYPSDQAALRGAQRFANELAEDSAEFFGCTVTVFTADRKPIGQFVIRPPPNMLQ